MPVKPVRHTTAETSRKWILANVALAVGVFVSISYAISGHNLQNFFPDSGQRVLFLRSTSGAGTFGQWISQMGNWLSDGGNEYFDTSESGRYNADDLAIASLRQSFTSIVDREVHFNNWDLGCNDLQFLAPYLRAISDRFNWGVTSQKQIIVDVGANSGDDALGIQGAFQGIRGMCKVFGNPTLLLSVEPSPKVFCELSEAVQQAKQADVQTHLLNIALSSQTGNLIFRDPGNEGGGIVGSNYTQLEKISKEEWTNLQTCQLPADQYKNLSVDWGRMSIVPTYTLDLLFDSVEDLGIYNKEKDQIYVVKIDSEGHDYEVIRGAAQLLEQKRIDFLIFEIFANRLLKSAVEFMSAKGYECYLITPQVLVPLHVENWWYPHLDNFTIPYWANALCGISGSKKTEMFWRMYHSDDGQMANAYWLWQNKTVDENGELARTSPLR